MIINDLLHIKKHFVKGQLNWVSTCLHSGQSLTSVSGVFMSLHTFKIYSDNKKNIIKNINILE